MNSMIDFRKQCRQWLPDNSAISVLTMVNISNVCHDVFLSIQGCHSNNVIIVKLYYIIQLLKTESFFFFFCWSVHPSIHLINLFTLRVVYMIYVCVSCFAFGIIHAMVVYDNLQSYYCVEGLVKREGLYVCQVTLQRYCSST